MESKFSNPETQGSTIAPKTAQTQSSNKLIAILLVFLLIVQLMSLSSDFMNRSAENAHAAEKQARIAEIVSESEKERAALELLMTSYQADAYHGSLDRIAEQQLVATEYSIRALQILGKQNNAIIELLADQP